MALPFSFSSELKWSDHFNEKLGPFENGTDLYAVLLDKTANTLEVWRSTDSGDSWSEQDSANHKTISTTSGQKVCSAVQVGTSIYIAYAIAAAVVNIVPFSMSSNTFGTVIASGPTLFASVTAAFPLYLARRSTGDYVVLHQGTTETIMGTAYRRVLYSRFVSPTWTSNVDVGGTGVANHYDTGSIILGSSDRTHFFWHNPTTAFLRHRSLSSANVLGTGQDADANPNTSNAMGLGVLSGTSEVVQALTRDSGVLAVIRAASADTPTWSTQLIAGVGPNTAGAPGSVAMDGSTAHTFFSDHTTLDIYRSSDGGTGTWISPVEWADAVTGNGVNITRISSGIGVLYDDGGTVKYNVLSIVTATPIFGMQEPMQHDAALLSW